MPSSSACRLALALQIAPVTWHRLCRLGNQRQCKPLDLALAEGMITEAALLRALAGLLGCPVVDRPPAPLPGQDPSPCYGRRSYRSHCEAGECQVIAPTGAVAEMLLEWQSAHPLPPVLLTTEQALLDALVSHHAGPISTEAALSLPDERSARNARAGALVLACGTALLCTLALMLPLATLPAKLAASLMLAMTPVFVVAALAVLTATIVSHEPVQSLPVLPNAALPSYTLIVPLYREGRVVRRLLARLCALDYPPEKRQVILAIEADDRETLAALATMTLPYGFVRLTVPPGLPRTKPRALNAALRFARGELTTIYDAEDAPEPDQLRLAAETFATAPPDIGCLQARLGISNPADHVLTRRFAQDYAALFDCTKRGFAIAGWPVALGGTSNHFRTDTLRALRGWDAANVTEDADLGYRLALDGYRIGDLASTTWEEAPNTFNNWRNQRVRWLKGWFQTALVHLPLAGFYWRRLDRLAFLIAVSVPVSMLATALFLPLFWSLACYRFLMPLPFGGDGAWRVLLDTNLLFLLALGLLAEAVPIVVALARRQWLGLLPWIVFLPVTHVCVCHAAWLALWELLRRPHHWRKTQHGLARTGPDGEPDQKHQARNAAMVSPKTARPLRDQRPRAATMSTSTTSA